LNGSFIGAKCLLIGNHHLLEETAHANEVVHDSRWAAHALPKERIAFFGFVSV
jgi:hypothetical protein